MRKFESFAAENIGKGSASRFAPLRFVVARNDVIFHFQQVETRFYLFYCTSVSFFRQVACHQHKVDAVRSVDLPYAAKQIFGRGGIVRTEMSIRQLNKTKRSDLRPGWKSQRVYEQDGCQYSFSYG